MVFTQKVKFVNVCTKHLVWRKHFDLVRLFLCISINAKLVNVKSSQSWDQKLPNGKVENDYLAEHSECQTDEWTSRRGCNSLGRSRWDRSDNPAQDGYRRCLIPSDLRRLLLLRATSFQRQLSWLFQRLRHRFRQVLDAASMHCCWCHFCCKKNNGKSFKSTLNPRRMSWKLLKLKGNSKQFHSNKHAAYLKVFGLSTFFALFFFTTASSSSSFPLLLLRLKISKAELDAFIPFPFTLLLKLYSELDGFIFASKNLAGRNFQSKLGGNPCSAMRGASGTTISNDRSRSSLFLFFL